MSKPATESRTRSWLWPDHLIRKSESGILREEHNRLVNVNADLVEALREMAANCENRQDETFVKYIRQTCRAALRAVGVPDA
jgi:hypothetical protein